MGRGEKSLLCDPGSELLLGGREKRRANILKGDKEKIDEAFCVFLGGPRVIIGP